MGVAATRFLRFDGLRALAALSIVAYHQATQAGAFDSGALKQLAGRLDIGVPVFFVISGFLLYRPFVAADVEGRGAPDTGAYAWRRFLRIAPAYWVALVLVALINPIHDILARDGLKYFSFTQIYAPGGSGGIPQAWTLCIEVTFYAFLPLLAWVVRRLGRGRDALRNHWLAVAAVGLGGALFTIVNVLVSDQDRAFANPWLVALPNWLDTFAPGMALAVLSVAVARRGDEPGASRGRLAPWVWAGAAAVFALAAFGLGLSGTPGETKSDAQYLALHFAYAVFGGLFVLPAVFGTGRDLVGRVLSWRPLVFCGVISYGIYLWHPTAFELADRAGLAKLGLLFTIGIAWLSWQLVERPALSLKRLIPGRPAPTAVPPAITPLAPEQA
ncbi:MAG: acyltransferase family protein [Solirubrobacteraceae bacterium]